MQIGFKINEFKNQAAANIFRTYLTNFLGVMIEGLNYLSLNES